MNSRSLAAGAATVRLATGALLLVLVTAAPARAQTWLANPVNGNYSNGANWTPAAPLNNGTDTESFGSSSVTSINAGFFAAGWTFNPGASSYQFSLSAISAFTTSGITVNGGSVSIATNGYQLQFQNGTAGTSSINIGPLGALIFFNSSTAGNSSITNNNGDPVNGGIFFYQHSTGGNAAITNGPSSSVDFSATSGPAGNHQVSLGSLAGGGVVFLGSNSLTVGGNNQSTTFSGFIADGGFMGGTGASLVKVGTGVLTLSANDTYTGGTTVNGGTLALAGSGALGVSGASTTVNAAGTLDLGGTTQTQSSVSLNGGTIRNGNLRAPITSTGGTITDIGGTASLTITAGTTFVTGTNTFAGPAVVNGGTLNVTGSMTDPTVNAGGTLMGTGTVGATQVNAGGTLAPGNGTAGSSMTISGSLAFQSGAIYLVSVNPSTASSAMAGSATLGGATVNALFAPGSYASKQYTILTAGGGVSGTFGSLINTNLPSNFRTALSYDANDVYLNLILNFGIPGGINGNQQAVGNALTGYFNANGGIPLIYSALNPAGLTQASGEGATGSQQTTFNAMEQFIGLLTDPFAGRGSGINGSQATGYAEEADPARTDAARRRNDAFAAFTKAPSTPFVPRWSIWAAGFGGTESTSGNAAVGSNNTTSRIAGTAVGAEYLFSPDTLAGFALAGGGTSFGVNTLGSGRSDLFQAGAYVRHTSGAAYVTGALAYGWQDITTDRTVTIAGIDRLRAAFNANAYSGRAEGGYRFVAPWIGGVGITPYAAGQFTTFDLPVYVETVVTGTPNFALNYAATSVTDARSELGIRTDKSFAMADGVLTLRGRLAWSHDFDPNRSIGATFQALPGEGFVVNGARAAADSGRVELGSRLALNRWWEVSGRVSGEFSSQGHSYSGIASVRASW